MEGPVRTRTHTGPPYLSYLLRMWCVSVEGGGQTWRASVESPLTQKQDHFEDLESFFAFVRRMCDECASESAGS